MVILVLENQERMIKDPQHVTEDNSTDDVDTVKDYNICTELCIPVSGQIHEKSTTELSAVVSQIVDVEGPVHISEVVRRIRIAWGLKRAGKRIQDAVMDAIVFAQENGDLTVKDEFLYPNNRSISVRRRSGDPPAKINLICDDEIVEAVKIVIRTQFASPMTEIVRETSRLFGIKVTRGATAKRIEGVVQQLIDDGELEVQSNGMINFSKS